MLLEKPIPAASAAEQASLSGLVAGIRPAEHIGDAATVKKLETEIASQPRKVFPETLSVAGAITMPVWNEDEDFPKWTEKHP